jgi:hypothetical protein
LDAVARAARVSGAGRAVATVVVPVSRCPLPALARMPARARWCPFHPFPVSLRFHCTPMYQR